MEKENKSISINTTDGKLNFNTKIIKKSSIVNPKISIIIRCKNEDKYIEKCISSIFSQKISMNFEVIIIDSGSEDNTIEYASKYDVNIYSISKDDFNFGTSIMLGYELSNKNSEYCVYISAHAIPKNEYWLINLINKFDDDIVATYSKQTYYNDTYFIEKRALDETFGNETKVQQKNKDMSSYMKYRNNITFSNASSCIKKEILKEIPFRKIIASEDREWAYRVLNQNYKIVYASDSIVYHCHNESIEKYFHRIFINSKALYEFTGVKINIFLITPLILLNVYKDLKYLRKNKIKIDINYIKESIKYRYNYALAHYKASREND